MIYPSGPGIRESLEKQLDMASRIADKYTDEGKTDYADGMRKAVKLIRWQMIGTREGCVITTLDPRRDEPEWAAVLAEVTEAVGRGDRDH